MGLRSSVDAREPEPGPTPTSVKAMIDPYVK